MLRESCRPLLWFTVSVVAAPFAIAISALTFTRISTIDHAGAASRPLLVLNSRGERDDNPRVVPGMVHWHPSCAAAMAAASKSGKPVLLFQMMGRLDHQFC
ncbi:MAG: hypothetical protein ACJ8C4_08140 [Gemmataceae bacterium]